MKYFTLSIFLIICFTKNATSQENLSYDHLAIIVKDVDVSADFYENILGLKEIYCPLDLTIRRWFSMGGPIQLHLIEEEKLDIPRHKSSHFALKTTNFDGLMKTLKDKEIQYSTWDGKKGEFTIRPDGVRQIYIQDPDENWIEINERKM